MIQVSDLSHTFPVGNNTGFTVLNNINFEIEQGKIAAIMGKSGSGKSTLLNLLSGYLKPRTGRIVLNDKDVTGFNENEWAKFRLNNLGFVFQSYQLISSMTVFENVQMPLMVKGISPGRRTELVFEMLEKVGLYSHTEFYPDQLSGGQQQRTSVARALINNPEILLADEPTGSLDSYNEKLLLELIYQLNDELGITVLLVTHDKEVAEKSHEIIRVKDGHIIEQDDDRDF
ncbi:ABC transporter ATP-binding protein [Natranaerobius thermophilus]|uniref:ABC transporter related n=1 Tax=Natranaerobius thermophilus (strain ATCC BAA-1301 / DSM 18059 / JW/NM-WN-LF) TaxID=457570 RepID=B2A0S1_NATTJ|nr:ABC transporter ATP-binding protein [Natranaerobius thermophilus]ACB85951.1 ABC transporter related [Natranaerobius thermophilus JW/NM-WN-LF]